MDQTSSQYHSPFEQEVKSAVVGEHNVIYNYFYYREQVNPPSPSSPDDENLPCPYQGLFHFGPEEADFFFGREIFIEQLYTATQSRKFIPLLGASGSGKSSVVLAGLVPRLQKQGSWQFTHFRPGSEPFHALALALVPLYTPELNATEKIAQGRTLATYLEQGTISLSDVFAQIQQNHPTHRVLLIADQFEEIYTLCPQQEIRHQFLDCLLASLTKPSSQMVLVTTMRADFLANALSYRPFADVLQNADLKIAAMNREELTQVITKPAEKLGVSFEGGLVERILDDVADQPGNLPLLEFALTQLWNQRLGKQLTHSIYEAIGEVEGALARYADEKYGNLTAAQKEKVQRIFIQLVRPGEGAEDTRRIAVKAEMGEESWSLIKELADARLVVTSRNVTAQETVEVVHEALIRNWGELRTWIDSNREFRAWQERLRAAKEQWKATDKDPGSLLRGAALAQAQEKLQERPEDLIDEREFIEQSIQEQSRIEQVEIARRKREITTAWGIAAGSLVAVVVSIALGLTAMQQRNQAELNEAESLGRYSLSLFKEHNQLMALVEAIRAGKILQDRRENHPEVIAALQNIFYASQRWRWQGHDRGVSSVTISPDGKTLASGSWDNTIKIWDVGTGELRRTLQGHDRGVYSLTISPDGKTLASGSDDNTIKIWDLGTGELRRTLQGHDREVNSVTISPDGKTLASGSWDNTIKIWDVGMGDLWRTLEGHNGGVLSVTISPDGKTLASGSTDKTIRIWDVDTQKIIHTLEGHNSTVLSVTISPDGKTLASGSGDKTIKIWDLGTRDLIRTLPGHNGGVSSVTITPDGKTLASGSHDNTIKIWDLNTGNLKRTLQGHNDVVSSVTISPDGKTLASGSWDDSIKIWDLATGGLICTLEGHSSWVLSVTISRDGKLASGSYDKPIKIWDLDLDLDSLIQRNCDWVRNYLQNSSEVSQEDRGLCDDIRSSI
ncbi:WD40 repeat domain-containing protein [Anabaenopsis sp. FSS-46]|uniref:nSTAND1 domain-containing NTPase n=1 Tax=Anabaenopsis sp. FSS-46 TaxID=2971766 RepID=UPI0024746D5D|nr:WD40 repeat domain-containing protein [Anabaenopsis sp. FSS-46]MDH6099753.1 WD40 repeat domain-containing protein [Anabaenopsis sp. FSS-46]